jgi:hypothetical protein
MQTIAAAACRRVIHREVQVVPPQEPLEGTAGFLVPSFFSGDPVGFQAGRDHGLCFHRLLIKAGTFASLRVKTIGADGNEMLSFHIRALYSGKPAKRLQPHVHHGGVRHGLPRHQHGM